MPRSTNLAKSLEGGEVLLVDVPILERDLLVHRVSIFVAIFLHRSTKIEPSPAQLRVCRVTILFFTFALIFVSISLRF